MEEEKQNKEKLSFKTVDDLSTFLMDIQGQMANMQETIDKIAPVEESSPEAPETPETQEEPTDDEISEIDQLLQTE
ncbi:MAG: hypothetical protein L0K90_01890 [Staphylococcus equorum]|nr:hypothetical protein [Staphylococcus equorum]MDN6629991.1 hypothetical protein [Staphylococcus equorum]